MLCLPVICQEYQLPTRQGKWAYNSPVVREEFGRIVESHSFHFVDADGSAVKRILFCKQFFLNKAHGATAENEKSSVLGIFKCLTSRQTFQPVVALELIGVKKCLDFFDNVLPIDCEIACFHGIIDFTLHLRGHIKSGIAGLGFRALA